MACGKTTLGCALPQRARDLGLPVEVEYVDLDSEIEAAAGMSIPEIFALPGGHERFRELEHRTLERLSASEPTAGRIRVTGCGGGTPCFCGNMELMLSRGTVVLLKADSGITVKRLLEAPAGKRPLVDAYRSSAAGLQAHIEAMQAEREPFYSRAHHTFDSSRLDTLEEVALTSEVFLKRFVTF